jgi:hypothetical protein
MKKSRAIPLSHIIGQSCLMCTRLKQIEKITEKDSVRIICYNGCLFMCSLGANDKTGTGADCIYFNEKEEFEGVTYR